MAEGTANPEEIKRWSAWIESSDKNREKAREALSEIAGFKFSQSDTPDVEREWMALFEETVGEQNETPVRSSHKDSGIRWIYRVAAVLLLVGTVVLSVYMQDTSRGSGTELKQITQKETILTAEGQQKTLTFTNGSKEAKVILNSSSSITYNMGLIEDQPIQVTLRGEAFFDVEKGFSNGNPAFSVSTPDGIIEDLGTEFLLTTEKDRSRVVLQEGSVNVRSLDDEDRKFEVRTNEMVEFSNSEIIKQETVNSTFYTSWATGSMRFEQTKISTFAEYVEQRFPVEVKIVEPELSDITLEGAVYFKSLEGLVRSISDITQVPVYQSENGDTIYIGNLHNSN